MVSPPVADPVRTFRCLAKMQRAGKAECPLCRAKTVLLADKCASSLCSPKELCADESGGLVSSVSRYKFDEVSDDRTAWPCTTDTTLSVHSFMVEWFPLEVKEKQKSNEKEVAQQDLIDMGLDAKCIIM
jgi:hypothetical protein